MKIDPDEILDASTGKGLGRLDYVRVPCMTYITMPACLPGPWSPKPRVFDALIILIYV